MTAPRTILLSRTDSIGDVMLTLPVAGLLKKRFPGVRIVFLGRSYTAPVLHRCSHVDEVITLEELAVSGGRGAMAKLASLGADVVLHVFPNRQVAHWCKGAGIARRIGTSHRWWHWTTCNERVSFGRKNSDLHEAQLNVKLLRPLGIPEIPTMEELASCSGFTAPAVDAQFRDWFHPGYRTVVLHPRSKGSAVEWGLENYAALIRLLNAGPYITVVTGTQAEAEHYRQVLPLDQPNTHDAGGLLKLDELISLIGGCHGLVAASTGPLHIAAACGIRAIGLYSPRRPIHPGRWAPIGRDVHALVYDPACTACAAGRPCDCITRILPQRVFDLLARP